MPAKSLRPKRPLKLLPRPLKPLKPLKLQSNPKKPFQEKFWKGFFLSFFQKRYVLGDITVCAWRTLFTTKYPGFSTFLTLREKTHKPCDLTHKRPFSLRVNPFPNLT